MIEPDEEDVAGCNFFVSIVAPQGMIGIEPYLPSCRIPFQAYKSNYNGHLVLRVPNSAQVDWNMDASNSNVQTATGRIAGDEERAKTLLGSLSEMLGVAGFPHRILLDDQQGNLHLEFKRDWRIES